MEVEDVAAAAADAEVEPRFEVVKVVEVADAEEEDTKAAECLLHKTIAGADGVTKYSRPPGGVPVPDRTVTKIEDGLKTSMDMTKLSLKDKERLDMPTRPVYATGGRAVVLWANYVALEAPPKLTLHRYDISVTPEVTGKKLTQVVRLLLEVPDLAALRDDVACDFKATLVSRRELPGPATDVTVRYRGEDEETARESAPEYRVRLRRYPNALTVSDLKAHLTSADLSAVYDDKLPMIQALNIFLNHYAKSSGNLATIGASKVFAMGSQSDTFDLGGCLTAVRGFFASVRAATGRILVNVNVSHGAFYNEGPLLQLFLTFGRQRGLFRLESFIKGLRVRTTHLKERKRSNGQVIPRVKTIFGLAGRNDGHGLAHPPRVKAMGAGAKDVEFWLDAQGQDTSTPAPAPEGADKGGPPGAAAPKKKKKAKGGTSAPAPAPAQGGGGGGRYISVYDFFSNTYGIQIANPEMPVVNVGNRANPTYLPLQVCHVLPGQAAKTKLDPGQTQSMIRFAVRRPAENVLSIVNNGLATAGLSGNTNPLLARFGISATNSLITVPGRVLNGPRVVYKQKKQAHVANGSWNMVPRDSAKLMFDTAGSLSKWSCLYIDMPSMYPSARRFNSQELGQLVSSFHGVLRDTGMAAAPPLPPQRVELSGTDDEQLDTFMQRASSSLQMLLVILPTTPIPLYDRLKQLGDVKYGVHTVCSVGSKMAKPQGQDQYLRNLALKFNLKLGGVNQSVDPGNLGVVAEGKTMVVGIDVTHPSPGSASHAPSIAGMVASIDARLGQWPGVLSIQSRSRQEMVSDLGAMLKSRLALWRARNKSALPENILVYRDGVSEGQYQLVLDTEVPLLREACRQVYPAPDQSRGLPRMAVVVVGKRHHTRFYATQDADADRSGNTKPGTVVDRGVTETRIWDFFLQAHAALQGTARPAHYCVILDEIFRRRAGGAAGATAAGSNVADKLHELTQSMCYVFGRATKAVSICTPAYYADILCERARCYLKDIFDAGSVAAPSSAPGSGMGAQDDDVRIHARLKDSMFYI
ncbi:PAZ domain [Geosmithia morbida]|uniref:PAZ domain n=1 Tax=Geosmithia morbida TaxID=1094350 RepID=A0A9P5CZG1_9HYPO|nr:PAZ domain [Geosmithia morbida]KAF4120452.1 PAZ domain [Geosmithia morbida]